MISIVTFFIPLNNHVYFFLQVFEDDKLQESDKVRVLDPYDGVEAIIGQIHSLYPTWS